MYFSIFLVLGGSMFVTIAWRSWKSTGRIMSDGIQTQGRVVELSAHRKQDRRSDNSRRGGLQYTVTAYAPVVRFTTFEGDTVTYYATAYTNPCPYTVGQTVDIWYLPEDPQQATLNGADAKILPLAFGIFGSIMLLVGLIWGYYEWFG